MFEIIGLSNFGGETSDNFHSHIEQEQREGYQGEKTYKQSGEDKPEDVKDFHSGSH